MNLVRVCVCGLKHQTFKENAPAAKSKIAGDFWRRKKNCTNTEFSYPALILHSFPDSTPCCIRPPFLFFVAGHADLVYGSNVGSTRDGVRFRRVQEGLELNTRGENRDYQDRSLHWQGREEKMQCIHVKQR